MKQLTAFIKKEFLEQLRGGRLLILGALFCLFGIMNPATAKMLPWLLEIMADQLADNGMLTTGIEVNALTSWMQFFKNIPVLLIVFIVMFSSILTAEYQKGTLINVITKGMKRWKILLSKLFIMSVFWTAGYLIAFGITYGYTVYFWGSGVVQNLLHAAFGYYLAGLWLITVILLTSAVTKSSPTITLSVGAAFIISYLLSFIPELKEYVPTFLMSSNELLSKTVSGEQCLAAAGITAFLIIFNTALSVAIFNKRAI